MFVDFIQNGRVHGEIGEKLVGCRFEPGLMRPFIDSRGQRVCTVNVGRHDDGKPKFKTFRIQDLVARGVSSPVFNATSLRKEEWIRLDEIVLKAARLRMRAWADLAASNSYGGFNGMGAMILEHETMSDPGEAVVDMDGLTDGRNDAPKFQLEGLPLPITHSDFWFSSRFLAMSRNKNMPIDVTMGEAAGRRVGESIEKVTIGVDTGVTYGGNSTMVGGYGRTSSVYGYTNFSNRLTNAALTVPTGSNPDSTVADVLNLLDVLSAQKFYGPFMMYHSTDWTKYMDNDYARLGGNNASMTLRDRLRKIESIMDVRRLDFLRPTATASGDPATVSASHAFTMLLVQMTSDVCRAVNGMDITTVQWESVGGMRLNFKVMAIQVPQLRADHYGNCGILHATTA